MKKTIALVILGLLLGLAASPAIGAESEVVLMSHDSFNASKEVIAAFEAQNGLKIKFLKSGDAGLALNQAILSKSNPLADVFFGVDNTFLSRALKADIFEPYASPRLAELDDSLKLDPQNRLLPVDFGDVCLNYDKAWFAQKGLAPPQNLDDLIKPEYAGLTVVENPATSSPGLAFLLATVGHYGPDGFVAYWKKLKANRVAVADGWKDAYFGHFSRAENGDRPIVVSYASSPPVEVIFSEKPLTESPTAAVVSDGSAFRQIEFVGVLKGAQNPEAARKLVDFLLSRELQEDIPLQMYVYPANKNAALPEVFVKHSQTAKNPAVVSPEDIATHREEWLDAWTDTVLR